MNIEFSLANPQNLCYNNPPMKSATPSKKIVENRKARRNYHLFDRYEAGIALQGAEVKSLRAGKVEMGESYARIEDGEVFLLDMHISPYDNASHDNHEPKRPRKLLLHKREISKLDRSIQQKGFTIVPTRLYFNRGLAKVEIALARGKHEYDKRDAIKKRDADREIQAALRDR